jgi:general secretion pathway protein I
MQKHKGFSLLEILVAFAVMAIALTIVMRIFGTGIHAATLSEEYTLATQIAESLMVRIGVEVPLQVGELSGIEADKYDWRIRIAPVNLPLPEMDQPFQSQQNQPTQPVAAPLQLLAVSVNVSWGEDLNNPRSVELNSLRLFRETTQ